MFNGEKKYGYTDGQQIGWYGATYPVFVRIINGVTYSVGKEQTPGAADLGKVYKLGRAWLTAFFGQVAGGGAADAALFVDGPHYALEPGDGSDFTPTIPAPTGSVKAVIRPVTGSTEPVLVPSNPIPPAAPISIPPAAPISIPPLDPGPTSYQDPASLPIPGKNIPLYGVRSDGFPIYDYPLVHLIGEDFRYRSSKEFTSVVSLGTTKSIGNIDNSGTTDFLDVQTNTGHKGIVPLLYQGYGWYAGKAPVTTGLTTDSVTDWLKKYWYVPLGGVGLLIFILLVFRGASK